MYIVYIEIRIKSHDNDLVEYEPEICSTKMKLGQYTEHIRHNNQANDGQRQQRAMLSPSWLYALTEEKENTYPQTSESQTPMKTNKVQKDIPSTEKTKQRQRNSKLAPPTP